MPSFSRIKEAIFGKRLTPEKMLRQNHRALTRAMREMEREIFKLEQHEKNIVIEIKKLAKKGEMESVKIMAKDIVQTRNYIKKFMIMKANIQSVSMKILTLKSQQAMSEAMKGVAIAMKTMNYRMNIPKIRMILQQFEKESAYLNLRSEMVNDYIEESIEDNDDEQSDEIVTQVFEELGLQISGEISGLPEAKDKLKSATNVAKVAEKVASNEIINNKDNDQNSTTTDADIWARLKNLRKNDK